MKDRPLLLVKLGGSCLTNKSEFETIAEHRFQETVGQLVQAICSSPHIDYIVIHGAGSFGHFHARKYQVLVAVVRTATLHTMCRRPRRKDICTPLSFMQVPAGHALPWQVAETHASVSKLSCMVASEILRVQKELPNTDQHRGTLSVSPFQQGWVTSGGSLTKDSLARAAVYISDLLAKGCATAEPLHHGSLFFV
jgi:hypothetical protein